MRAFVEAVAKQPEYTLALIEAHELDAWARNKAIQKARESRCVPDSMKDHLKALKH